MKKETENAYSPPPPPQAPAVQADKQPRPRAIQADGEKPKRSEARRVAAGEGRSKMSWQAYVDDHLMCELEGQTLTSAAIVGHDGSVWARSTNFPQYKPEEIAAIMTDFDAPGTLAPTGLFLGGTKYMVIQGEAGSVIRGKKGTGGITIKKTNLALIIGIYDEPMTPGQCNMIVERLGDYLLEQSF